MAQNKQIPWVNVSSTNIAAYRYFTESKNLQVKFKGSEIPYTYFGVPENTVRGLRAAKSKGSYFYAQIKTRFRYKHGE